MEIMREGMKSSVEDSIDSKGEIKGLVRGYLMKREIVSRQRKFRKIMTKFSILWKKCPICWGIGRQC